MYSYIISMCTQFVCRTNIGRVKSRRQNIRSGLTTDVDTLGLLLVLSASSMIVFIYIFCYYLLFNLSRA